MKLKNVLKIEAEQKKEKIVRIHPFLFSDEFRWLLVS